MSNLPTVEQASAKAPVNETLMLGLRNNLGAPIGTIHAWYDYNGSLAVPATFMLCDGSVISEANYNSTHGSGAWDDDVVTTALDGLYLPNLNLAENIYLTGNNSTQSGTGSISYTGISNHQINIAHAHSHNHKWYDSQGTTSSDNTYNSSGNTVTLGQQSKTFTGPNYFFNTAENSSSGTSITDSWTDTDATSALSSTQSIQPRSIEVKYIMKIV